jgi:hypothetical protein
MKFWLLKVGCFSLLLFACQPKEEAPVNYKRILVLGNSITYHPPDPSIGWNAAWGMAATAANKDYFSLLKDNLKEQFPELEMIRENVYPFERKFYALNLDQYDYLKEFQADLIIIRLGENIPTEKISEWNFSESIQEFAAYLSTASTKVLVTTTFWPNPPVNEQLHHAASQKNWEVVNIVSLGINQMYMAIGKFENEQVARHPNDVGMQAISSSLAKKILNP